MPNLYVKINDIKHILNRYHFYDKLYGDTTAIYPLGGYIEGFTVSICSDVESYYYYIENKKTGESCILQKSKYSILERDGFDRNIIYFKKTSITTNTCIKIENRQYDPYTVFIDVPNHYPINVCSKGKSTNFNFENLEPYFKDKYQAQQFVCAFFNKKIEDKYIGISNKDLYEIYEKLYSKINSIPPNAKSARK